ncbi:hypothetical protein [Paenibacillus tundrae]
MRWVLGLIWVTFIIYAWLWAPGQPPGNDPIFGELITMQSREPWLLVVFSWLGIFPAIYACLLLRTSPQERGSRFPVWPFVILSFGLGAFALLPYFAWVSAHKLTPANTSLSFGSDRRSGIRRLVRNKLTHGILLLLTLGTFFYGLTQGNVEAYVEAFSQSSFVHIMTIDFVILSLLSVLAIYRDAVISRRSQAWAWISLLPLVGPLVYLLTSSRQNKQ